MKMIKRQIETIFNPRSILSMDKCQWPMQIEKMVFLIIFPAILSSFWIFVFLFFHSNSNAIPKCNKLKQTYLNAYLRNDVIIHHGF